MTAVDRLAALEQAHAAATPGPWEVRFDCPEEPHHHDWDEVWIANPDGATVAVLQERYTSGPADAAAIVAEHNATPLLIAALRAVLDLAGQWEGLAAKTEQRAHELAEQGDDPHASYRSGRADSYAQGATRIRSAIEAALGEVTP